MYTKGLLELESWFNQSRKRKTAISADIILLQNKKTVMADKFKPESIEEYINAAPRCAQTRLREMPACLRKVAPGAQEGVKWGQPSLSYSRILFTFAAFKNHISLYPTPSVVKVFARELVEFKTSGSTIQFPLDKPLPLALIQKIAEFRVRESLEKDAKWK